MGFGRSLCNNALVGYGMAATLVFGRDCDRDVAVSCRRVGVRAYCQPDRARRIWIKSVDPAACDTRAHRYAAYAGDFPDRPANLAKNSGGNRMDTARADLSFFIAHRGNVDQGPDRLCVSTAWHRHLRMVAIATEAPRHSEAATNRVVWLVAMDRFAGCLSRVGNRRDFVCAWFL